MVPSAFFQCYSELGITPTQAILILHVMSRKWDSRYPFPSVTTLSKEMGIGTSQVRSHLARLEKNNLVKRRKRIGRSNEYDVSGLMEQLEKEVQKRKAEAVLKKKEEEYAPHS